MKNREDNEKPDDLKNTEASETQEQIYMKLKSEIEEYNMGVNMAEMNKVSSKDLWRIKQE